MFNSIALSSDQKKIFLIDDHQLHTFSLESGNGVIIGLLSNQLTVASPSEEGMAETDVKLQLSVNINSHQSQLIFLPIEKGILISTTKKDASIMGTDLSFGRHVGADDINPTLSRNVGADDINPTLSRNVGADDINPTLSRNVGADDINPTLSSRDMTENPEDTNSDSNLHVGADDINPTLSAETEELHVGADDINPTLTGSNTLQRHSRVNLRTHNVVLKLSGSIITIKVLKK